jgi:hypothetical protein
MSILPPKNVATPLDRDGRVVYKSGRGPFGFKPHEMEQSLIMLLLDRGVGLHKATSR